MIGGEKICINTGRSNGTDINKIMAALADYTRYYAIQAGGGRHGNVGNLYRSGEFLQRGYGIGSFFANFFKYLKPLAVNGLKALGSQSYKTGQGVFRDIIDDKPLEQIIQDRSEEAIRGLAERGINKIKQKMSAKQDGRGIYKRTKRRKKHNTSIGARRKRTKQIGGRRRKQKRRAPSTHTKRKKRPKRTLDIFQ